MRETIEIVDQQQWLAQRMRDITSTEVSALYGLSPYLTEFELFHQKREGKVVRIEANERMTWGTRLEATIAQGAAEDHGWEIEHLNVYMRDPEICMGSSFDFKIVSSVNGPGLLEIKNVDGLQYARNWVDDGEGNIEAPQHIELQLQHQLEVADLEWGAIVALVGGNELKVIYRKRDRAIGQDLRNRIGVFWKRIESNLPPTPDYEKDAEFIIKQLHNQAIENLVADVTTDESVESLIADYQAAHAQAGQWEIKANGLKAQILERIGPVSKVISKSGTISCGNVKDSLGTFITPELVGQYVGGRKGYRNFRFYAKKEK
jgi:putative phage-type endonuclease